jgi:hypothetical protein
MPQDWLKVGSIGAAFFVIGVLCIWKRKRLREITVWYRNQHPALYSSLFFGEWLAQRPRVHEGIIVIGGIISILISLALMSLLYLSKRP